jgi:hypothetical protein
MTQTNQVKGNPPPLTIVQPGEREVTGDLGGIGVAFKLWGRDTNGMVSVVEHPIEVGPSWSRTYTLEKMSTPSSPKVKSAFVPAVAKWSSVPVATSPNLAAKCTPCGTQVRSRHG